jgi:hypothetical protein
MKVSPRVFFILALIHGAAADIEALAGRGSSALAFALVAVLCWLISRTPTLGTTSRDD